MSVTYRLATVADAPALSTMARRCFAETFGAFYRPEDMARHLEQVFGPGGLAVELADPGYRVWMAEEGGLVAGFLKLAAMSLPVDHPAGALEIKQLYVLAPWQGTGVAQALTDWSIETARADGAPCVYLSVWSQNDRAIAFYRRQGFVMDGFAPFAVGDQIDMDPVMRLDLGNAQ